MRKSIMLCLLASIVIVSNACSWNRSRADIPGKVPVHTQMLKANPWVSPPRDAKELEGRLKQLRAQYAPFLRSLPDKLEVRKQQSLDGQWRSKFELDFTKDTTLERPPAPAWYAPEFDDSAWETVTVPEWRWSNFKPDRKEFPQPSYPDSVILWYRKTFDAPRPAPGQRVFLSFAGVDWEAQVWLNGKELGTHVGYAEPFRFDVTDLLRERNCLAVRVFEGPGFGEPIAQWSILPHSPANRGPNQRFVFRDRANSIPGFQYGTSSSGASGFGIHREVCLETTAQTCIGEVFARGYPETGEAKVMIETDSLADRSLALEVQIMPENFKGRQYRVKKTVAIPRGPGRVEVAIPMPNARLWWPAEPCLYRCRVTLHDGSRLADARDALFGCRSVKLVSSPKGDGPLADGQVLLNGQPIFLRGTSVGPAADLAWYWGETEKLTDIVLLLKAANFNTVRNNQHVAFDGVREVYDRLGILSQQEQGSGYVSPEHRLSPDRLAKACAPLARVCYNNPRVILLSFMNEAHCNMTEPVAAILAQDPDRLMTPISGALFALSEPRYGDQLLGSFHNYDVWYGGLHKLWEVGDPILPDPARSRAVFNDFNPNPPRDFFPVMRPWRMNLVGEYGVEALDCYETMLNHYPPHWGKTPGIGEDKLWGARQVGKGEDIRQVFGLRGRMPKSLGDYIEASQAFQADALAEQTKGFRLSKRTIAGYYQFHFIDATPALWPKAIVSHDLAPKKAYFAMAQVNQPIVPLYQLLDRGAALDLWVANDLAVKLTDCALDWQVRAGGHELSGRMRADAPATGTVRFGRVDLRELPQGDHRLAIALSLKDARGRTVSVYRREIYRNFELIDRAVADAKVREVWAAIYNKTNIAVGKPVTATSESPEYPAKLAVDGQTRNAWRAADATLPQSLTVDLGASAELCGARVVWQGRGRREVRFELSDDNVRWRPPEGKLKDHIEEVPRPPLVFLNQRFAFQGRGRYVRVTITAVPEAGPVQLNELELYQK